MFSQLKSKKIRSWCLFDFGISSYPTLILTFFYGAFYAKKIASNPTIGTSFWGFAISSASVLSFLLFSFILINGRNLFKKISTGFFRTFFYVMIITSFCLVFFNDRTNQFLPLILVVISFISFEFVNLFYNLSLYKVRKKNNEGAISNLGWAFGYLGGLISLLLIYLLLTIFQKYDFIIFGLSAFLLIGPFVALWSAYFGSFHFKNFQSTNFHIPNVVDLIDNIKSSGITTFLISYFFFNNAVISIFAFASMFAAFLFGLSELQILFLGVFINLFGIFGCLIIGSFEDKIGSENTVKICVLGLLITTLTLFFIKSIHWFWILALIIGFFVGPIQASSRSVLVKKIKAKNQLSAFCVFSMFGNLCAILGPFVVGITVDITGSIRDGILVIPIFFCLSLFPYMRRR